MINIVLYYSSDHFEIPDDEYELDADRISDEEVPSAKNGGWDWKKEGFIGVINSSNLPPHVDSGVLETLWEIRSEECETTIGQVVRQLMIAAFKLGIEHERHGRTLPMVKEIKMEG